MNLDTTILHWLNSFGGINEWLDALIVFVAIFLWYWIMAGVLAFVAVSLHPKFRDKLRENIELLIIAAVSAFLARFVVVEFIRFLYNRPRPFEIWGEVTKLVDKGSIRLVDHTAGGAFPSGHAALAFAVAATIYFYYPKTSLIFWAAAVLIGLARVAAGVHWPSDILGGAVVGVGTAWLLRFLFLQYKKRRAMPSADV